MLMKLSDIYINDVNTFDIIVSALENIDKTGNLAKHSINVAYIMSRIADFNGSYNEHELSLLVIASILHDIGIAWEIDKTTDVAKVLSVESGRDHVFSHSIYSYIFFKYVGNLGLLSYGALNHHLDRNNITEDISGVSRYASLLHVVDDFERYGCELSEIDKYSGSRYNTSDVELLKKVLSETTLGEDIPNARWRLAMRFLKFNISSMRFKSLLRVMLYGTEKIHPGISRTTSYNAYLNWCVGRFSKLGTIECSKLYLLGYNVHMPIHSNFGTDTMDDLRNSVASVVRGNPTDLIEEIAFNCFELAKILYQIVPNTGVVKPSNLREAIDEAYKITGSDRLVNVSTGKIDYVSNCLNPINEDIKVVLEMVDRKHSKMLHDMNSRYLRELS